MAERGPLWRRFWPERIASQIAVLIVLSVLALHLGFLVSFLWSQQVQRQEHPAETTGRVASVVLLLDKASVAERAGLLEHTRRTFPELNIELPAAQGAAQPIRWDPRWRHMVRLLGPRFSVSPPVNGPPDANGRATVRYAIKLGDGTGLSLDLPPDDPPPPGPPQPIGSLLLTAAFILLSLSLLGTWAVFTLTKPLRAIATTVEAYGPGQVSRTLPETGPREIRSVARALNQMQDRITRLVDDRTRALAAVSHDLRTPITRLRLRAEFVEEPGERGRMISDLDQMDALVQSALTHLRDGRSDEAATVVDLPSLLQTVSDSFADLGRDVPVSSPARLAIRARPLEIERAVTNLTDNAWKYGVAPRILLSSKDGKAIIDVVDDGPGIPADKRSEMLQPFVRGEAARSMNDQDGFGLGLTIARTIVEAHGGELSFHDAEPKGFIARITLPLA
jgi:signal transduction histidine kinase